MPSIGDTLLLQRRDLLTFPKETVDLILEMQKDGWRGHRNTQGHVKMLAPDGKTHVMATQNPRSPVYVRSGYRKYNKEHGKEEMNSPSPKTTQKWPCARPGCPKTYATEQHLNDHIAVDHEGMLLCPETDCHETFKRPAGLGLHRSNKHGYISPTKEKRAKQRKIKENIKKLVDPDMVPQRLMDGDKFDVKEMEEAVEIANGGKFDTELLSTQITKLNPEVVRTDDVFPDHIALAYEGTSLKGLADPVKIRDRADAMNGVIKDVLEGKLPNGYPEPLIPGHEKHYTGGPSLAIEDERLAHLDSQEVFDRQFADEEQIHFLDDRDSWVIDDAELMTSSVNSIRSILKAVGLEMEIRVWRKR